MALKQLLLSKRIEAQRAALTRCQETEAARATRRAQMQARGAELEAAVAEVTAETPQEERDELEELTSAYETDEAALAGEEAQAQADRAAIEGDIKRLTDELEALNKRAEQPGGRQARTEEGRDDQGDERREGRTMESRKQVMGMTMQERDAFFARQDVKDFLVRVRALGRQERAVTGADLTIPTVVLELLRENVIGYSKLYKHVNVRRVAGKARQIVMGTFPEGVWTEMCAKLNEIDLGFNAVEVDGYKVGGYIAICKATLEDSDVALGTVIIEALGQAIGLAVDKAILYGKGTKMPLGILPRLAQKTEPTDYPETAREWENLSTSNVIAITSKTGLALFQAIATATGAAKGKYSRGRKVWAMSEATQTKLIAESMSINAAGAIEAGVGGTMPVIGGAIEVLDFIPDDVIIGGYMDLYLLAERAGTSIAMSEHARFIEDQVVYRGTARYDGLPVIAEAFVAMGIGGVAPSATAVTFAEDKANAVTPDTPEETA